MTTKIALQITTEIPRQRAADAAERGLIIDGRTGRIEQMDENSDAVRDHRYIDDLYRRADLVIDTVTISHRQPDLLPSPALPMIAQTQSLLFRKP